MFDPQRLHADAAHAATRLQPKKLPRHDNRVIIHFDYDCFYAACFEVERPELSSLPLAIQQKQIIVTCNYEARRRGLYKLQLITEAKKACPEVIIILGEDLTRFRNYSKALYNFLRAQIWSGQAEKLGFDEVWLDVTDMIDYNMSLLSPSQLADSWFCLDKNDPTQGFSYDATKPCGGLYPKSGVFYEGNTSPDADDLVMRLTLGSHLAFHLRKKLESEKRFTSTVGISTNKVLSKLVGNVNKPKAQTTLLPPYGVETEAGQEDPSSNVQRFLDHHEVGQIPGIGHKGAQQIRGLVKGHHVAYHDTLVTHDAKEQVTVRDARLLQDMGPELLESTLGGPGAPRGIGGKIWGLLHGVDDNEVSRGREIPRQISIEDTYLHLHDLKAARQQLTQLSASLIRRMQIDLTTDDHDGEDDKAENPTPEQSGSRPLLQADRHTSEEYSVDNGCDAQTSDLASVTVSSMPSPAGSSARRWIAHPRTIRLSTRERKPQRSFARISRSSIMPGFVFNLATPLDTLATKLTTEILLPMFIKLVPSRSGFDVNLLNIAATNMQETAGDGSSAVGRDIAKMFVNQEKHLKNSPWRVEDKDMPPDYANGPAKDGRASGVGELDYEDQVVVASSGKAKAEEILAAQRETGRSPVDPGGSLANTITSAQDALSPVLDAKITPWQDLGSGIVSRSRFGADSNPESTDAAHSGGPGDHSVPPYAVYGSEDFILSSQQSSNETGHMEGGGWDSDVEDDQLSLGETCATCGAMMPAFALEAHTRFHETPD